MSNQECSSFEGETLKFMDTITDFVYNGQRAKQISFRDFGEKILDNGNHFINGHQVETQKNYTASRVNTVSQDIREISIAGDQNKGIFLDELKDFIVRSVRVAITDILNSVASFTKHNAKGSRTISINEKFHGLSGYEFLFVCKQGSVVNTSLNGFGCHRSKFFQDLVRIHSCCQSFEDDVNGGASVF